MFRWVLVTSGCPDSPSLKFQGFITADWSPPWGSSPPCMGPPQRSPGIPTVKTDIPISLNCTLFLALIINMLNQDSKWLTLGAYTSTVHCIWLSSFSVILSSMYFKCILQNIICRAGVQNLRSIKTYHSVALKDTLAKHKAPICR